MTKILVGTSSWTDKTLIECGRFYPAHCKTAEARPDARQHLARALLLALLRAECDDAGGQRGRDPLQSSQSLLHGGHLAGRRLRGDDTTICVHRSRRCLRPSPA